jgi:hypothetical protein
MEFKFPKIKYSEVMDSYRSYSRIGRRRLSHGSMIRYGILRYALQKNVMEFEKCISDFIDTESKDLNDRLKSRKGLSEEAPFSNVRVALYCFVINDYARAAEYLLPFHEYDKSKKSKNIYNVLRYALGDIAIDGRLSSGAIQSCVGVKGSKFIKESYINWLLSAESKDRTGIETSMNCCIKNHARLCSPNQIFYCEPESILDLWSLGLSKYTIHKGIAVDHAVALVEVLLKGQFEFNNDDISDYNSENGDKSELIGSVELNLKLHSFDGNRVCRNCKRTLENVVFDSNDCMGAGAINYQDQYPDLRISKIDQIIGSHFFNEAGWCKNCLRSIGSIIREEKECSEK